MNPTAPEPSLLLTVGEAASSLRVSTRTVVRLVKRGELKSIRIGRRVLLPRDSLKEFAATGDGVTAVTAL